MKIYSGFSIYGTDILVEKALFKKAKDTKIHDDGYN